MDPRERAPQPVRIRRDQNKMHMVGHQAPRPHVDGGVAAMLCQEVAVKRIIVVAKEGARTAVAALGDVVRNTGNDDASEPGHAIR